MVRIGHGAFFKDKGSTTSSRQSDEMRRIVNRVSLDYLVDEKMKQHKANDSVAKQFLKYIDIRKKVHYYYLNVIATLFLNIESSFF